MARRRQSADMNLDSLLDTLTNVVGVLVMVLMLTTLNVRQAVERIFDLDPTLRNVSAAELERTERLAEEARQERLRLTDQVAALGGAVATPASPAAPTENLGALLQQIEALKAQPFEPPPPEEPLNVSKAQADEAERRAKELAAKLVAAEEELAKLKALLDKTQVVAAPPAKIVSLPNPRDAPPEAKQYQVLVRNGRIVPFNPAPIRERCKKQVETLLRSPALKTKSGSIDCEKLVEQFNKSPRVLDPNFRIQLAVVNFQLQIVFELKPSGGETAAEATAPRSELRRGLKALQTAHGDKFYLRFLVWNDSFDAYVAARSVCDEMGVLAGWDPHSVDYVWREGLGMTVPCEGRPAPPKPAPAPAPAPAAPTEPPKPPPNDVVD